MRPRPASRRRKLTIVPAAQLAKRIEPLVAKRTPPAAIVSGVREWIAVKRQPEAQPYYRVWPGNEETFCDVPVIVRAGFGPPRVYETHAELEAALLGD